eukprot:1160424-Pelagomonas_calceolata.AAC.2
MHIPCAFLNSRPCAICMINGCWTPALTRTAAKGAPHIAQGTVKAKLYACVNGHRLPAPTRTAAEGAPHIAQGTVKAKFYACVNGDRLPAPTRTAAKGAPHIAQGTVASTHKDSSKRRSSHRLGHRKSTSVHSHSSMHRKSTSGHSYSSVDPGHADKPVHAAESSPQPAPPAAAAAPAGGRCNAHRVHAG